MNDQTLKKRGVSFRLSFVRVAWALLVVGACSMLLSDYLHLDSFQLTERLRAYTTQPTAFVPEDWCPGCSDAELCGQAFLFIVATGRSGSTTLLNAVNAVPGIHISGENKEDMENLRHLFTTAAARSAPEEDAILSENLTFPIGPHHHNTIQESRLGLLAQQWIRATNPPPSKFLDEGAELVLGFKDIVWTPETLDFAESVCPCSRFVFNYRKDVETQAKSAWWGRDDESVERLHNYTKSMLAHKKKMKSPTHEIALEDFSPESFTKLARWLGGDCEFENVAVFNANSSFARGSVQRCV